MSNNACTTSSWEKLFGNGYASKRPLFRSGEVFLFEKSARKIMDLAHSWRKMSSSEVHSLFYEHKRRVKTAVIAALSPGVGQIVLNS
jgi:hypothetical protein